ncbi:MAG: prevent-host-death protein [Caldilineaceae bacterium]
MMKAQYDFSKAQRGKFYRKDAIFHYPVDIEPVNEDVQPAIHLRPYGLCAGEFVVPDDFDDPLPVEILKQFE